MREHLYEKKSQKVSLTTIHRLVETPNNAFNSGIRYKGLINARVGAKSNRYRGPHLDAHYLFARNKMRREMPTMLNDSVKIIFQFNSKRLFRK